MPESKNKKKMSDNPELEESLNYLSGFDQHINVKRNIQDSYTSNEQRRAVENLKASIENKPAPTKRENHHQFMLPFLRGGEDVNPVVTGPYTSVVTLRPSNGDRD